MDTCRPETGQTSFYYVLSLFPYHFTYLGPNDIISGKFRYHLLVDLYLLIPWQYSFTFWYAALPGLVRNLPEVQASAEQAKKRIKAVSAVLNIHRPSSHPLNTAWMHIFGLNLWHSTEPLIFRWR